MTGPNSRTHRFTEAVDFLCLGSLSWLIYATRAARLLFALAQNCNAHRRTHVAYARLQPTSGGSA
jgi:hypothetical protein